MSLNAPGGGIDYLALAKLLISMTPMQRRLILVTVKIMKSKFLRLAIVMGAATALVVVIFLAAQSQVSPILAWALITAGALVALVIVLRIFKIL